MKNERLAVTQSVASSLKLLMKKWRAEYQDVDSSYQNNGRVTSVNDERMLLEMDW